MSQPSVRMSGSTQYVREFVPPQVAMASEMSIATVKPVMVVKPEASKTTKTPKKTKNPPHPNVCQYGKHSRESLDFEGCMSHLGPALYRVSSETRADMRVLHQLRCNCPCQFRDPDFVEELPYQGLIWDTLERVKNKFRRKSKDNDEEKNDSPDPNSTGPADNQPAVVEQSALTKRGFFSKAFGKLGVGNEASKPTIKPSKESPSTRISWEDKFFKG